MMEKALWKYSWEKSDAWDRGRSNPCPTVTNGHDAQEELELHPDVVGKKEGSHRAPRPSKEQQHILGLKLLSPSHNIAENSAVFPCTLCIDVLLINQWTPVQKPWTKTFTAEQEQRLLKCTTELGYDTKW